MAIIGAGLMGAQIGAEYALAGFEVVLVNRSGAAAEAARERARNAVRFLSDNELADPDANEVVTNVVGGDLVCTGNSPKIQVGDSGGSPNVVHGKALGQCAHIT